jgi:hypothetical protein
LRLRNSHWTEEEKKKELQVLDIVRKCQQLESTRYQNILGWSSSCLFIGCVAVIVLFFFVMKNIG